MNLTTMPTLPPAPGSLVGVLPVGAAWLRIVSLSACGITALCQLSVGAWPEVGVDVTCCGGQFQIGAATAVASLRVPDSLVKKMGRWKSSVFIQ